MPKLSIKAILLGSLLDVSVSFVLGVILGISIASGVHETNQAPAAAHAATLTAIHDAKWVYLAFALMSSMLGGYVSAKIAQHHALLHGACSSVLCLALGIATMIRGASVYPLWVQFLLLLLSVGCGTLGGYLWLVQQTRVGDRNPPHPDNEKSERSVILPLKRNLLLSNHVLRSRRCKTRYSPWVAPLNFRKTRSHRRIQFQ